MKIVISSSYGEMVKNGVFWVFMEMGDFGRSGKMSKKVKNVKNSDFLVNMKYAVFCCF